MENTSPCTCSTDRVLMRQWAANLRQKARLIRNGVGGMADSCDDLARIIEEYVERTSNAPAEHSAASADMLRRDVGRTDGGQDATM